MTMKRIGSTKQYAMGWERAFGKPSKKKKTTTKRKKKVVPKAKKKAARRK